MPIAMVLLACYACGVAAASPSSAKWSLPADRTADRTLLIQLGSDFRTYHGPCFTVLSDAGPKRARSLLVTAARTLSDIVAFSRRLDLAISEPDSKMTVVFFDAWADYERFAREAGFHVNPAVPGFHDGRSNRCLLFNYANAKVIRTEGSNRDAAARARLEKTHHRAREIQTQIATYERLITMTVVRHEIAHLVLTNLGLQSAQPSGMRWLREGLAMQFEGEEPVNRHRLDDFLAAADCDKGLNLAALVGESAYIGPGAKDLSARYSIAWALVYDLIHERPRAFATYLKGPSTRTLGSNGSARTAFEAAFGHKPDAAFERGLTSRMNALVEKPEQ
ncbi:MAG: DUF1570 domain-containing protein [Phycisphaerae bacterium]